MKIALTGVTGFIGRAVVAELRAQGHELRLLARNAESARGLGGEMVVGDLGTASALDALARDRDAVVHIAGAIKALNGAAFRSVNEAGARLMAEAARKAGVKRFVHISSLAAREPQLSDYAASKRAGEDAVAQAAQGMSLIMIRPPAVYGPGDRATLPLFRALIKTPAVLVGSPKQRFSLLYAGDLARIVAQAVTASKAGVVEVDDGRPRGYSWDDVAHIVSAHLDTPIAPYFLPQALTTAAALASELISGLRRRPHMLTRGKIRELLHNDWVAEGEGWPLADGVGFVEGFGLTLEWYRTAGWLPRAKGSPIKPAIAI